MLFVCRAMFIGFAILMGVIDSTWAQRVSVDDLSTAMTTRQIILYADQLATVSTLKGQYFKYVPLKDHRLGQGVLIPQRDQSTAKEEFLIPEVRNGSIPSAVAASLYDKLDQLRRQEHFGGPKLLGFALIKDTHDEDAYTEIGLLVEHMAGFRLDPDAQYRTAKQERGLINLFLRMSHWNSGTLVPLDFHSENVVGKDGVLRPVDVSLLRPDEILPTKTWNPRLYHLRMHQVAYTLATMDQSLNRGDLRKLSLRKIKTCKEFLSGMRRLFTDHSEFYEFAKSEIAQRKVPMPRDPRLGLIAR